MNYLFINIYKHSHIKLRFTDKDGLLTVHILPLGTRISLLLSSNIFSALKAEVKNRHGIF